MNVHPLGIDIAKAKFNACLVRDGGRLRHKAFANTQVGFPQLAAWLVANGAERVHACLESTGTYGEALATHLADAGHRVSVARPGGHQSLRRLPALQGQDRPRRRRADRPLAARRNSRPRGRPRRPRRASRRRWCAASTP